MVDSVCACVCVYDGGEHSSDVCANSLVKNNRSSLVVLFWFFVVVFVFGFWFLLF